MHEMLSFMVSVAAGVTSNLISKWLDRMLNKDMVTLKKKTPFFGAATPGRGFLLLV